MGVALAAIADDDDFFALDQVQVGVAIVINTHGRSSWLGGRTARIVMSVKYRRVVRTRLGRGFRAVGLVHFHRKGKPVSAWRSQASCDLGQDLRPLRHQHDRYPAHHDHHPGKPQRAEPLAEYDARCGSGGTRQSQANRSNIGTSRACRSRRLPIAKLSGEIISTANAPALKSYPTVPQIIRSPMVAMAMPTVCIGVGISRNATTAKAMVNSAWLCTTTLVRPTGTPCAMP